jgi:hypothetical protein
MGSRSLRRIRAIILGPACVALLAGAPAPAAAAKAPPSGPACEPATLDDSALLAGAVAVSPLPGSRDAPPQTQISFVGAPSSELSVRSVVGTLSGRHGGRLLAYSQGDGASFVPGRPFAEGERVTVRAQVRGRGRARSLVDTFAIAHQDQLSSTPETIHAGSASEVQAFHSRPDLRPPVVAVTTSSPQASPGDVFLAPYTGPGQAGPMILDGGGNVVWFKPLPSRVSATNFRVQEYAGEPVLTWWQGDVSIHGFGVGTDVIVDSSYRRVAAVKAGNGLQADLHEFQLTPRGTALITAYDPILCNLGSVGGPAYGAVTDGVVQEVDVRTGLVRMQWTSLDHVALAESYERTKSSLASPFDYFHVNSINLDPGGDLLISARNTWAIYDVQMPGGTIGWRLGGRHSSFNDPSPARTAWQHDPRPLPGGGISIFDNGSSPTVHRQSRGILLSVNAQTRSVSLVGEFTHPTPLIAESQGNLQALADGDWFVGWGQTPYVSEFSPQGALLFDAHLPPFDQSYRAYRFAWTGTPVHAPSVAFQAGPAGAGTAYASWNGATQVAAWRLLAGSTPATLATQTQVPKAGFETAIAIPAGTAGPDLAVQALDASGNVLGTSTAVSESASAPAA